MYGCEAEGAAGAANVIPSAVSLLLPPQPRTPHVGTHTVGFPGGSACPWSGSTAASMQSGTGRKAKTQLPQTGPIFAPTVMHLREVRAAKFSSLPVPHCGIQKRLDFSHLRKIPIEDYFQPGVASPGRTRHTTDILQLWPIGVMGERVGQAWCNPASPSAQHPRDFPSHRLHLQRQL